MDAHVYILRCADGAYYVGSHRGEDVANRVADHNNGLRRTAWTYRRRPVLLVWAEYFDSAEAAIGVERQLKGWTRAKKEALIRGDWAALRELARCRAPRPSPLRQAQGEDSEGATLDGGYAEAQAPTEPPSSSPRFHSASS